MYNDTEYPALDLRVGRIVTRLDLESLHTYIYIYIYVCVDRYIYIYIYMYSMCNVYVYTYKCIYIYCCSREAADAVVDEIKSKGGEAAAGCSARRGRAS